MMFFALVIRERVIGRVTMNIPRAGQMTDSRKTRMTNAAMRVIPAGERPGDSGSGGSTSRGTGHDRFPALSVRAATALLSLCLTALVFLLLSPASVQGGQERTIIDAAGRTVRLPQRIDRVVCSGAGCLRLLTYLSAHDLIVAVDSIEKRSTVFSARPYTIANPQFRDYPLFGEFRGFDQPELIVSLERRPQVIFKTFASSGYNPDELQSKTGIPVVVLNHGDLGAGRQNLFHALRLMGAVVGKERRAGEVIAFFEHAIRDLGMRTTDIPVDRLRSCFVGGIAFKGPHGLQSTEAMYPPIAFVNAVNVAAQPDRRIQNITVAKEQIVAWDPSVIFLDLSTIQLGDRAGALFELKTDAAYRTLSAVRSGNVYGVLPYNWYSQNLGSILADAYFIGKVLYPWRFTDIDPKAKADEIYAFLVGKEVFAEMNAAFASLVFEKIPLE